MKQVVWMMHHEAADLQQQKKEENIQLVSEAFVLNPQTCQRRVSSELQISRTSLRRIMKYLKLKSYKR